MEDGWPALTALLDRAPPADLAAATRRLLAEEGITYRPPGEDAAGGSRWRAMGGAGRLEPVDVILRRVDAAWCDPLDLRQESRLGVPGLLEAARLGTVAVVNGLGSGVAENPGPPTGSCRSPC